MYKVIIAALFVTAKKKKEPKYCLTFRKKNK